MTEHEIDDRADAIIREEARVANINRYRPMALMGVVLAALPDVVNWLTTDPDAPHLPQGLGWALRVLGLLLAAQGKPLVKQP